MGTIMTWIIGAIVIGSGIFLLVRAIRREAVDGKCAGCSGGSTCSSCPSALPLKKYQEK
jgi:hypothetical protein